jgi:CubicO group peptidase (beta-lactamase class C family)
VLKIRKFYKALIFLLLPILIMSFTFINASGEYNFDTDEIRVFMDELFASQLQSYNVPGATVAVVKDGEMVFAKGYGYADIENSIQASAEKTLFRIGSVSKLFVWTAVMQLAEQEKIDLNEDINKYLTKFKIPNNYEKPVTMLNLMNHNAGFEERAIGESVGSAADIKPLEEYLIDHMPARVRAPGEFTAYSNYGASLAGYIISQISGMPYEQYIEEHILKPLNMNRSTFVQPLPSNLKEDVAVGYSFKGGKYKAHDFEWKQSSPAGAMSSTGVDMANFMIAMLNKGSFQGERILNEKTALKMQEQSFTNDNRVNGIAHGFMVLDINSQRIISHGGDIFQFHSSLILLPEQNVGFFVSYNGADGMAAVNNTITEFMDHFYPNNETVPDIPADLEENVSKYNGTYMPLRHEYTTLGKLVGLMQSITIKQSGAHRLKISLGFPTQLSANYVQIDEDIFKSEDVPPLIYGDIVFGTDLKGNVLYQFQKNNPTTAYVKLPWYAEPYFTVAILGGSIIASIIILISSPFIFWIKRRLKYKESVLERRAVITSRFMSISSLVFILGFGFVFSKQETVFGLPDWSKIIFVMPYFIALSAIGMSIFTVLAWKKRFWGIAGRIYYTVITFTSLSFVWWMYYWNLWVFKV